MKMISEWRRVVTLSLSFWMQVFGLLVLIGPELYFYLTGNDYDPVVSWWAGVLLLVAGLVGRLIEQGRSKVVEWLRIVGVFVVVLLLAFLFAFTFNAAPAAAKMGPVSEAEALEIAVPHIIREEGVRLVAYLDIVGVPTICAGSTRGVKLGMRMTMEECMELVRKEVAEYRKGLYRFFNPATILTRLTPARDAAYTSTAFNAGIGAIGNSTATRRLNSGDIAGGCEALTWWNKAGGRVIRGLVMRRARERALCLQGL